MLDRLVDSVQYDKHTKKEYFAMPLTLEMTMGKLFWNLGLYPVDHLFLVGIDATLQSRRPE